MNEFGKNTLAFTPDFAMVYLALKWIIEWRLERRTQKNAKTIGSLCLEVHLNKVHLSGQFRDKLFQSQV